MKRKPLTRKEHDRMRRLQKEEARTFPDLGTHIVPKELVELETRHKLYGDVIPPILRDIFRF